MTKVCLVTVTPDAEKTIGYIARVSNPNNQDNPKVAGLLKYAHSLTATGCASINSYKRILPGSWSPAHICWGHENRSTLVRIPGKADRRHIELRHGDNINNPYIFVNTVLTAGLDGIKNKLSLEKPVLEDAGQYTDIENSRSLEVLPRTFSESLSFL